MLKLATVFSGIGAIEHALDRMQIEHEIVFACDNGDVELEMPQVSIDIDSMEKELKTLRAIIKKCGQSVPKLWPHSRKSSRTAGNRQG